MYMQNIKYLGFSIKLLSLSWVVVLFLLEPFNTMECRAETHQVSGGSLTLTLDDTNGSFTVLDSRNSYTWSQDVLFTRVCSDVVVNGATMTYTMDVSDVTSMSELDVTIVLSNNVVSISFANEESMGGNLDYPFPFISPSGAYAVLPMNEGYFVPVDEISPIDTTMEFYAGFSHPLPMFGYTDMSKGYMVLVETPLDAQMLTRNTTGLTQSYIRWVAQKGVFGYTRTIKIFFYDVNKGYVEMAQDVRAWMEDNGFVKTLDEKIEENSDVDKVVGAYAFWLSRLSDTGTSVSNYLLANGISKAIVYGAGAQITANGHLTGTYRMWQDSWDPATSPTRSHRGGYDPGTSNYTGYGYAKNSSQGWIAGYDGGYKVCRRFAYEALETDENNDMMRDVIAEDVAAGTYKALMVDTESGTSMVECYDSNHLVTRSTDISYRNLIGEYEKDAGFVIGDEQGQWWSVPTRDYLEGMWTVVKWWTENPTGSPSLNYMVYQVGYEYRIPFFQLVFHDCVVSYNRWDDTFEQFQNEDEFFVMNRKALFFMLYGQMPLSRPYQANWDSHKSNMVRVAKKIYDVVEPLGTEKMVNHEFLNDSHSQQRTTWENGTTILVDFDNECYELNGDGACRYVGSSGASAQ